MGSPLPAEVVLFIFLFDFGDSFSYESIFIWSLAWYNYSKSRAEEGLVSCAVLNRLDPKLSLEILKLT